MDFVVEAKVKGEKLKGILIKEDKEFITLKLDSGYNANFKKSEIKILSKEKIKKTNNIKQSEVKIDKKLPKVMILHTGGTIASKVDYKTGAVISRFSPEELINLFPEILEFANVSSKLIGNMWSQDMRFTHYNIMAKEIQKAVKEGFDAVILTQGTDTLHYTSAALSFMLEDSPIPVLVVGSQRSSDRPSSDASINLVNAIYFATKSNFAEVGVCMHNSSSDDYCAILPGTKVRKTHTSRRDAFKAINSSPFALVDYKKKEIKIQRGFISKDKKRKLKLKLFDEKIRVGVLKQYTNMYKEDYEYFKKFDGLVIESTGLGNLPVSDIDDLTKEHGKIFKSLQKMIENGLVVVLSPQCIFGRLNVNVYENGRRQQEIGILGNYNDMTTETTYIKLAWLLSNYKKDKVKELIMTNLRGELTQRTLGDKDFI